MWRRKKNSSRSIALIIALLMLISPLASSVYALDINQTNRTLSLKKDNREIAMDKIEEALKKDFKENELIEALIYLEDQVDTMSLASDFKNGLIKDTSFAITKTTIRRAMVESLRDRAATSQSNLIEYLKEEKKKGKVEEFKSYHIVNMLYVKASKEVIENIAFKSDVERIYANKAYLMDKPIVVDEIESSSTDLEWNIERVKADQAWELGIDGSGIVVGILDSGVEWDHPALKNQWRGYNSNTNEISPKGNWFDPVYNAILPADTDGHGTHVMGTLVGQEEDGKNKIGVAPGARWIAARVFDSSGMTTDNILLSAAEWMLAPDGNPDLAPDIINNSWGGLDGINDWYRTAVRNWRAAGILPVFAAGNQRAGEPAPWPGSIAVPSNYPESFAVAATDRDNKRASFSKLGPSPYDSKMIKPNISAPGVNIRSSVPGGLYRGSYSGTSMAAPHVAGVAALILSANTSLSLDDLEGIITDTASPLTDSVYQESPNFGYGYGIIDAFEAISKIASGTGHVEGQVLKEGADLEEPTIIHEQKTFETFGGMEIDIEAEISDDVSITEAGILVKQEDKRDWIVIPMERVAGDYKKGSYRANIGSDLLTGDSILYKIYAKDYSNQEMVTKDYKIDINFGIVPNLYEQGFENDAIAWLFDGEWEWGQPSGSSPQPYEGKNLAATNLRGNYEELTDNWLVTPPIDLRDETLTTASIRFHEWYDMGNNYDSGRLLITEDGGNTWTALRENIKGKSNGWKEAYINLDKYIGKPNPIYIGFQLKSLVYVTGPGWYIDNVRLLAIDNEAPSSPRGLEAEISSQGIKLKWDLVEDLDLSHYNIYRSEVAGGEYEKIGESSNNVYIDKNVEEGKTYYYVISSVDDGGNASDYSSEVSITALGLDIIFATDFEEDNGGFTKGVIIGNENCWEWGKPTSGPKEAFSGEKLWATKLSGNYTALNNAYIESPNIELAEGSNPFLTFNHWYDIEETEMGKWDYGQVLISEDGKDWINITPTSDGRYGGHKKEWETEEISLADFQGKTIKIRFLFTSDSFGFFPGWYIDDFYIYGISGGIEGEEVLELDEKEEIYPLVSRPLFANKANQVAKYKVMEDSQVKSIPVSEIVGIPVENALVTILETGKSVRTNPATGKFTILSPEGYYTLRAEAYGFYPQDVKVNIKRDKTISHSFILEEKPKLTVEGRAFDRYYGGPAAHASIKVLEDPNIEPIVADEDGSFTISDIYIGDYTLMVKADGFESAEIPISISQDNNPIFDVPLKRFVGSENEIGYDDGTGEDGLVMNDQGYGLAVRFTPEGYGKLKGTRVYFWDESWPSPGGNEVGFVIYEVDGQGLIKMVGQPMYTSVVRGSWSYIDLSNFNFATDKDFYISTIQNEIGAYSPGIAIDESSKHGDRSYMNMNGEFQLISEEDIKGGLMIRAVIEYSLVPPEVTNLEPINYTNQESIILEGKIQGANKVNLYVNGERKGEIDAGDISEDSSFSFEINLLDEINTIRLTTELDGVETEPSEEIVVIKDRSKPILEIVSPHRDEYMNVELIHIRGRVIEKYLDKLTINENKVNLDEEGNFYIKHILEVGENQIIMEAIDLAGNKTIEERKVYVNLDGPEITNMKPSEDIIVQAGEEIEVSFSSEAREGQGFFKISLALGLESLSKVPMIEEDGLYRGVWTVPEGLLLEEALVEFELVDKYGNKTSKIAGGKISVIDQERRPMEDLPINTIIIGEEAFSVEYLEKDKKVQIKLAKWLEEGKEIYVKLHGQVIVNSEGEVMNENQLPKELVYYNPRGRTTIYVR